VLVLVLVCVGGCVWYRRYRMPYACVCVCLCLQYVVISGSGSGRRLIAHEIQCSVCDQISL